MASDAPDQDDQDKLAVLAAQIKQAEERSNPSLQDQDGALPSRVQVLARVMRIGADFVTTILGALGLGWFVDQQVGSAPWCMLLFLLIGCVVAFWNLIKASAAEKSLGT
ncbi:MAG: AtpZ/AtpI family protein [Bdellovibrionales bacterium]